MTLAHRDLADIFATPVQLTLKHQFEWVLEADSGYDGSSRFDRGWIMAIAELSGTLEGYALYFFREATAQRIAGLFRSHWVEKDEDEGLRAIRDVMGLIASNAKLLLRRAGHASEMADIRVLPVSGVEVLGGDQWTAVTRLVGQPDPTMIGDPDEVIVYVDAGQPEDSHAAARKTIDAVASMAEAGAPGGGTSGESSNGVRAASPGVEPTAASETLASGTRSVGTLRAGVVQAERLEVIDAEGRTRAVISTLAGGAPYIVLADQDGRMRASVALSRHGNARVTLFDEFGRRVAELPQGARAAPPAPPRRQAARPRQPARRPPGRPARQPVRPAAASRRLPRRAPPPRRRV